MPFTLMGYSALLTSLFQVFYVSSSRSSSSSSSTGGGGGGGGGDNSNSNKNNNMVSMYTLKLMNFNIGT
jgi:hypothetical protein